MASQHANVANIMCVRSCEMCFESTDDVRGLHSWNFMCFEGLGGLLEQRAAARSDDIKLPTYVAAPNRIVTFVASESTLPLLLGA